MVCKFYNDILTIGVLYSTPRILSGSDTSPPRTWAGHCAIPTEAPLQHSKLLTVKDQSTWADAVVNRLLEKMIRLSQATPWE